MDAKRRGVCRVCTNPIAIGDRIDWDRDKNTAAHALCADGEEGPQGNAEDVATRIRFSANPRYVTCAKCRLAYDESVDPDQCPHGRVVAK